MRGRMNHPICNPSPYMLYIAYTGVRRWKYLFNRCTETSTNNTRVDFGEINKRNKKHMLKHHPLRKHFDEDYPICKRMEEEEKYALDTGTTKVLG